MFCPMATNIEQVLQALGQMTEMLRLMAVNQVAQAQQAQAAAQQAQQAQPGNRERCGVGLDGTSVASRSSSPTTTGRTSASSLPRLLELMRK